MADTRALVTTLDTCLALLGEFVRTASSQRAFRQDKEVQEHAEAATSPLPLLSNSSTALRSQVTKLSLLAINPPFTPSAIQTVLKALNGSVLPSLLTAALLVTPQSYTAVFHAEALVLTKNVFCELSTLVAEVKSVAEQNGSLGEDDERKDTIMSCTGRVWEACDVLLDLCNKGIIGLVVRKAEEYHALVQDAIDELEDWDPADDDDDFTFGDEEDDDDEDGNKDDDDDDDKDIEALEREKKVTLRIFKPIVQIYPAIIANRLKKNAPSVPLSDQHVLVLDRLMENFKRIPDHIDEGAAGLYESNLPNNTKYVDEAKRSAVAAVAAVSLPWVAPERKNSKDEKQEVTEDKFTAWAKTWLKVVDSLATGNADSSG